MNTETSLIMDVTKEAGLCSESHKFDLFITRSHNRQPYQCFFSAVTDIETEALNIDSGQWQ